MQNTNGDFNVTNKISRCFNTHYCVGNRKQTKQSPTVNAICTIKNKSTSNIGSTKEEFVVSYNLNFESGYQVK